MPLAVEHPHRLDLSCWVNDDKRVPIRWLQADIVTPIPITSATASLYFDLPDDDTWPLDPDTGLPIPPDPQIHVISSTTPGDPDGWIVADRYEFGEVLVYLSHN